MLRLVLSALLVLGCASAYSPCPRVDEVGTGGSVGPYTMPDPGNLTWNDVSVTCSNGARVGVGVLAGEDLIRDKHRVEPRVYWQIPLWQRAEDDE